MSSVKVSNQVQNLKHVIQQSFKIVYQHFYNCTVHLLKLY